jgi:hypothetical protein
MTDNHLSSYIYITFLLSVCTFLQDTIKTGKGVSDWIKIGY